MIEFLMFERVLDECLEDIRMRRATAGECLTRHPHYASELAPLLETALAVSSLGDVKPSEEFKRATRTRLALRRSPPRRRFFAFLLPHRAS